MLLKFGNLSYTKKLDRRLVTLIRQWDRIIVDNDIFHRRIPDPINGEIKQFI